MQNRQTPHQGVCPTHHWWYHTYISGLHLLVDFTAVSSRKPGAICLPSRRRCQIHLAQETSLPSLLTGDQHKLERVNRLLGQSFPPQTRLIDANRCLQIKLLLSWTPTGTRSPLWDWQTEIFEVLVFQSWNYPDWVSFPSHLSVVSIETPR